MVKNPPAISGDIRGVGSVPGSGRSPGGGHGNPLQYSCLENTMDRRPWRAQFIGLPRVILIIGVFVSLGFFWCRSGGLFKSLLNTQLVLLEIVTLLLKCI